MYDTYNWATASPIVNGWFLPEDEEEAYSEITLSYMSDGEICFVFTVKDENNETTVEYKEATIEETKLHVTIYYDSSSGYYITTTTKGEVQSCNYRIEGSITDSTGNQRITLSYNDTLGFYYFLPSQTPGQIILRSINYVGDDSSQQLQKTDYTLTTATSLKKAVQHVDFSISFDAGEYSKRVQVIIPVDYEDAFEGKTNEFGWYQIYQYRTDNDWPEDYCVIWNPEWWYFNDNNDKMYINFWVTRASASTAQTFPERGQIECYYI